MKVITTGKTIMCNCPRCKKRLKIYISNDSEITQCCVCKRCFNLSEAQNLTVMIK